MTKANKPLNRFIAILAVIAIVGILFVPAVSAGKIINYFPTQKTIKTITAVNYTLTPAVVTPKTIPFTYSPPKGATTTLPISPSDSGANPSYIPTTDYSSSTEFHPANYSKIGNAVTNNRFKPSRFLSGPNYISGGQTGENGLDQESTEAIMDYQTTISTNYKTNLSTEKSKIAMNLLQLIDPEFPVFSPDGKLNTYNTLVSMDNLIPADQLGDQGKIIGDVVKVQIMLEPGTNFDLITPYIYQEMGRGSGEYGTDWHIIALIPLKNLEKIAALKDVRDIGTWMGAFNKNSVTLNG